MLNTEWGLMIWTFVTFGIAVFVLWKYAFGPLQRVIDERRDRIQQSIDTAEQTRAEAAKLLAEYKETLARVRHEANEILQRSQQAGEEARAQLVGEARQEADRLVGKAHEQIERDTQAALQRLRDEVADLTLLATQKVAGKVLSGEDHRRLIEQALKEAHLEDLELGTRG